MPTLAIDIRARIEKFQQSLNRIEQQTASTVRSIDASFAGLRNIGGFLGGSLVFGTLLRDLNATATELDNLGKTAENIGLTTEALSGLRFAASFSNIEAGNLDNALAKLSQRLERAKDGAGESADAFKRLRLDPAQFQTADAALLAIADRFKELPDDANQTRIALDLFEETGKDFVTFLNQGSAAISGLVDEGRDLGAVIGADAARDAARYADEVNRLSQSFEAIKRSLLTPVITELASELEAIRRAREDGVGLFQSLLEGGIYNGDVPDEIDTVKRKLNELNATMERFSGLAAKGVKIDSAEFAYLQNNINYYNAKLTRLEQRLLSINGDIETAAGGIDAAVSGSGRSRNVQSPTGSSGDTKEGARILQQLQARLRSTRDLTVEQETQLMLAETRVRISNDERGAILNIARQIDAEKARAEAIKASERAERERAAEVERAAQAALVQQQALDDLIERSVQRQQERLEADADRFLNLIDPTREFFAEVERLQAVLDSGLINEDQFHAAHEVISRLNDDVIELGSQSEQVKGQFESLIAPLESGFLAAIRGGQSFSNVLKELSFDIAELIIRQQVLQPLLNSVFGAGGLLGGGGFSTPAALLGSGVPGAGAGLADSFVDLILTPSGSVSSQGKGVTNNYYNVSAGVSPTMVRDAVDQGNRALAQGLAENKRNGGGFK